MTNIMQKIITDTVEYGQRLQLSLSEITFYITQTKDVRISAKNFSFGDVQKICLYSNGVFYITSQNECTSYWFRFVLNNNNIKDIDYVDNSIKIKYYGLMKHEYSSEGYVDCSFELIFKNGSDYEKYKCMLQNIL